MDTSNLHRLAVALLAGCTVHLGDTGGGDPAEEFTNSVQISGGQRVSGSLPAGTFDLPAATGSGGMVSPNNSFSIPIPSGVSNIAAVNVSFGGGSFFRVPVSGGGSIAASAGSFCGNLSDICHQIECYEQVVTTSGTVSRQQAINMVLNCTGGTDCNGNQVCQCSPVNNLSSGCRTPVTIQYCLCPDFTAYYSVNSRRFSIADGRVSSQVQAAANAAVNYGTMLCNGT